MVLVRTNLCVSIRGKDKSIYYLNFNVIVNINVDWGLHISKYPGMILTH